MSRLVSVVTALSLLPAAALASEGAHEGSLADQLFHATDFWGAVLNFSLLVFILYKLGNKPLGEHLQQRRGDVERGIAEATEMKAAAQAKYDEYSSRLEQLDDELAKLRKDIESAAEQEKKKILAEAEETGQRLKRDTEAVIERHAEQLASEVTQEVVEAAVAAAEEVLRRDISGPDQERLASDFATHVANTGDKP